MSNSRIQQLICVIVVYSKLIKGERQVKTQSINKLSQSLRDVALVYARRDPMKATEYLYYLADCLDLLLGADVKYQNTTKLTGFMATGRAAICGHFFVLV